MEAINENSLKSMAINHILGDLIDGILNLSETKNFTIIVVDAYTAKILSSYLTMTEVLNRGIFSIESIYNKRHPFPNYTVIYFLSPTDKSCELLAKDFEDLRKPTYGRVHIFFSHHLNDEQFDKLVNAGVIKRTLTCKELNLSFYTKEQNVFDLDFQSGLKIFRCDSGEEAKLLQSICDRLYTVCATLGIYPYIQYQKKSKLCCTLTEKLEPLLNKFGQLKSMTRKGILLLTDRSIDPCTPLLHDYNYQSLIYDLFPIKKDNTLEINKKKLEISDNDDLWNTYKLCHIAEVFTKLSKDFEEFQKSDLSKVGDSNMESFEDMANALSNMQSYKLKTTQLSTHITLAEELNNRYKANHLYDIIELEQDIVVGENDGGKINNRDIFKNFTILKSKIQNQREDLIRILLTLYISLSIGDKDFNVLAGKLSDEESKIFRNLSMLGIEKNSQNNIERRRSSLNRDKLNLVGDKVSKEMTYSNLRSTPQLAILVEKASNYSLDNDKFPIKNWDKIGMPKVEKKYGTKNLFGGGAENLNESEDLGSMILFTIGGISRNEIVAIQKLEKSNLVNHHIVIGSTDIINANDYMKQLREVDKLYTDEIGNDCLDENMKITIGTPPPKAHKDTVDLNINEKYGADSMRESLGV